MTHLLGGRNCRGSIAEEKNGSDVCGVAQSDVTTKLPIPLQQTKSYAQGIHHLHRCGTQSQTGLTLENRCAGLLESAVAEEIRLV